MSSCSGILNLVGPGALMPAVASCVQLLGGTHPCSAAHGKTQLDWQPAGRLAALCRGGLLPSVLPLGKVVLKDHSATL